MNLQDSVGHYSLSNGSCIENSTFPKYADALMKNNFAYNGMLLGQKLETVS